MKRYKDHKTEQLASALEEQLKEQLAQKEAQVAGAPSAEAAARGFPTRSFSPLPALTPPRPSAAAIPITPTGGRRCGCSSKTASRCFSSSSWF